MPPDQPLGEPPRIAGPIQGPAAIGGQAQQRRGDQRRPPPAAKAEVTGPGADGPSPSTSVEPQPPDPLVAALDRLRATGERPADLELGRLLRGRREYGAGEAPSPDPAGG